MLAKVDAILPKQGLKCIPRVDRSGIAMGRHHQVREQAQVRPDRDGVARPRRLAASF
jgi:hypothetical protein